jgi:hypothetical protein
MKNIKAKKANNCKQMSNWILDKAKLAPQAELKEMLETELPKTANRYSPNMLAVERLAKFYNKHLNPSNIDINIKCGECLVKILDDFDWLKRWYVFTE